MKKNWAAKLALSLCILVSIAALAVGCAGKGDDPIPSKIGVPSTLPETINNGIHVLNTGWEDAIVLQSEGKYALVDAAEPGRADYLVSYLKRLINGKDEGTITLEFVLGSHAHVDHMGSMADVINHPDVTVKQAFFKLETDPRHSKVDPVDLSHYEKTVEACENNNVTMVRENLEGYKITLGNMDITLVNGAPLENGYTTNAESLCAYIQVGGFKALLAGDMTGKKHEDAVFGAINSNIDFLKVGHHGMGDSTGDKFAEQIQPKIAVYTNGSSWEQNSQDATQNATKNVRGYNALLKYGATQYATTDNGGILVTFDNGKMLPYAIKEFSRRASDTQAAEWEFRAETLLRPL